MKVPRPRRGAPGSHAETPLQEISHRQEAEPISDHERMTGLAPVVPLTVCGLMPGGRLHDGDLDEVEAWCAAGHHLADLGLVGIAPDNVIAALRDRRTG